MFHVKHLVSWRQRLYTEMYSQVGCDDGRDGRETGFLRSPSLSPYPFFLKYNETSSHIVYVTIFHV